MALAVNDTEQYTKRLEALQEIRDLVRSAGIDGKFGLRLPQICVVGDQTSGKSSLLGCLTGIQFPIKSGICTKVPIVVECSRRMQGTKRGDTCAIRNPLTSKYEICDTATLPDRIREVQRRSLVGPNGEELKVSMEEIRVRVFGPNQMDIIVVDLPGIINAGDGGKEETRELIRRYIKHDETLILVVSEAQMDDERIAALDLAREVDPRGERTMRILTMFDLLMKASPQCKQTACNMIKIAHNAFYGGQGRVGEAAPKKRRKVQQTNAILDLGPHAVICRTKVDGAKEPKEGADDDDDDDEESVDETGMAYMPEKEMDVLSSCDLPSAKSGIQALKARLPGIFAHLIDVNLPNLKKTATTRLEKAEKRLSMIGTENADPVVMIAECQNVLKKGIIDVEETVSNGFKKFRERIHNTQNHITQKFTDSKFTLNVFKAPVFQGESAFLKCFEEIIDWWRPIQDDYVDHVEKLMHLSMDSLKTETMGVSGRCIGVLLRMWREECEKMMHNFKLVCDETLEREMHFGTDNHYMESKYSADMLVPTELVDSFVDKFTPEDFFNKKVLMNSETGELMASETNDVGGFNALRDVQPVAFVKAALKKKLLEAREEWAKEFNAMTLDEQQRRRLYAAVKAGWAVEKKTYIDMILKETRDQVLDKRRNWIDKELLLSEELRRNAIEDDKFVQERGELKATAEKMSKVLESLNEIA